MSLKRRWLGSIAWICQKTKQTNTNSQTKKTSYFSNHFNMNGLCSQNNNNKNKQTKTNAKTNINEPLNILTNVAECMPNPCCPFSIVSFDSNVMYVGNTTLTSTWIPEIKKVVAFILSAESNLTRGFVDWYPESSECRFYHTLKHCNFVLSVCA